MAITINSAGIFGIDGYKVLVECELSQGLPGFDVVGLPDASVKESRERVRSAIKNYKYEYPISRITINLAPADIKKEGTTYDLPIFLAILVASKQISKINDDTAFVGELSLNGDVRPISGGLSMALALKESGVSHFFVPENNAIECSFCEDVNIYPVKNVGEVISHLSGKKLIQPYKYIEEVDETRKMLDFSDVVGQSYVKRALEVCAAGMHNILLEGSPGSGKSMMAKRFPSILPPLSKEEKLEVIKINSASGFTKTDLSCIAKRPFRSPHHTVSAIALSGGIGANRFPKPGEISLAHRGVLFLDELPEFSKDAIDTLRAPLEDKKVTISRVNTSVTYPSDFVLVAAMNPCKCGWYGEDDDRCICSYQNVQRYLQKISGPILDRIDIFVHVSAVKYDDLNIRAKGESSSEIIKRIEKARNMQKKRFEGTNISYNGSITPDKMKEFCALDDECQEMMKKAFEVMGLTARSYDRILKVARTIADLEQSENIKTHHLGEALQYRRSN